MFKKFSSTVIPLLMLALFSPTPSFAGSTGGATSGGNVGSYSNTVFTVPGSGNIPQEALFRTILGEIPDPIIVDVIVDGASISTQSFSTFADAYAYLVPTIANAPANETFTVRVGTRIITIRRNPPQQGGRQSSSSTRELVKLSNSNLIVAALPMIAGLGMDKAQAVEDDQAINTLTFEIEGEKVGEITIEAPPDLADFASIVAAISFAAGLELNQVQTASDMVLAGADPDSVAYLMLALKEVASSDQANIRALNFAINTFNDIIKDADLQTINVLPQVDGFMAIRDYLITANEPNLQS